jgi:CPA2 family monovalent cation:H+ antiporter-2
LDRPAKVGRSLPVVGAAAALGTAYVAQRLGTAPTIGAFLAGVAVGESDLRHRVSAQLAPFRDTLLGLFFVTVGMQVDPKAIAAAPLQTALWLALFVFAKPLLSAAALRVARYDRLNALRAATVPPRPANSAC